MLFWELSWNILKSAFMLMQLTPLQHNSCLNFSLFFNYEGQFVFQAKGSFSFYQLCWHRKPSRYTGDPLKQLCPKAVLLFLAYRLYNFPPWGSFLLSSVHRAYEYYWHPWGAWKKKALWRIPSLAVTVELPLNVLRFNTWTVVSSRVVAIRSISTYMSFLQGKDILEGVFSRKGNCLAKSMTTDYVIAR